MRAIDADKLLRNIEKYHVSDGKFQHWVQIQPTIEPERKAEWIPCSERLPEEDGLYLVTTSKGQTQVHVFNHNGNSEEYWMRCNKAWMPLPEPYRGEQE